MKAVYINLDPYLQTIANWINAGKPGIVPSFDPLPLAVTIPLGESVAVYCPGDSDGQGCGFDVGGVFLYIDTDGDYDPSGEGPFVATNVEPGLSAFHAPADAGIGQKYALVAVSGDFSIPFQILDDGGEEICTFSIPVLVRRETASGPVDLVDFTPPAAAPSASDIKSALVAAGSGALAGVDLGGAIIDASGAGEGHNPTLFFVEIAADPPLIPIKCDTGATLGAALGADSASI